VLEPDDIVVFKVGKKDVRREVVKRDDDTLTTEQVQSHWGEVQAAMLKELQTCQTTNVSAGDPDRELETSSTPDG
jgi:hypothetical protein